MECININIINMIEEIIENNKNKTKNMSREEEIEFYDYLIKLIDQEIESYNTSKLDNGQDEIMKTEKITVTFTTTQNQKNNINSNMTTIDLGECEDLLRLEYNLSLNETLYMKKMDIVDIIMISVIQQLLMMGQI